MFGRGFNELVEVAVAGKINLNYKLVISCDKSLSEIAAITTVTGSSFAAFATLTACYCHVNKYKQCAVTVANAKIGETCTHGCALFLIDLRLRQASTICHTSAAMASGGKMAG